MPRAARRQGLESFDLQYREQLVNEDEADDPNDSYESIRVDGRVFDGVFRASSCCELTYLGRNDCSDASGMEFFQSVEHAARIQMAEHAEE
jgi:hypothetical protein